MVGKKSSALSRGKNNESNNGCTKASNVSEHAATPGVLENMSMPSPKRKEMTSAAHLGKLRRIHITVYTYNRGVAKPNRWILFK